MVMQTRPLGVLMNVLEQLELDVSYAYDDLVFVNNNSILLRMEDAPEKVSCFFNEDLESKVRPQIEKRVIQAGIREGLTINFAGEYSLKSTDNEEIQILFNCA
jgi:hypothetical protein